MNLKRLMYKLQTALNMRGERVKINQYQRWSEKMERMVTKYVVTIERKNRKTGKAEYVAVCESYQTADVVKALADLLTDDGGGGG